MSLVVYEYPTLSILPQPLSFAEKFRVCVVPHSALDELHGADRAKEEDGGNLVRPDLLVGSRLSSGQKHGFIMITRITLRTPGVLGFLF